VRELLPALEAGLYGASFRFLPLRQEVTESPKASSHNPQALPEVTVTEASVSEFGPVTFRAYATATAGLRCCALTDELAFATLADGRKLDQLEAWNRAILRPCDAFREPPRTEMSEPLWGVENHADELPNWSIADRHSDAITRGSNDLRLGLPRLRLVLRRNAGGSCTTGAGVGRPKERVRMPSYDSRMVYIPEHVLPPLSDKEMQATVRSILRPEQRRG
jgi:hypothetical protein